MLELAKKALSTEKVNSTFIQFIRYTFVGGFAFLVDIGILFVLTEFAGFHYLISAGISFLAGLTTNYVLSTRWVFSNHTLDSKTAEFTIFTIIGLIGLGLNELSLWIFTEVVGLYYILSKLVSTFFVYTWNFGARKIILFR